MLLLLAIAILPICDREIDQVTYNECTDSSMIDFYCGKSFRHRINDIVIPMDVNDMVIPMETLSIGDFADF